VEVGRVSDPAARAVDAATDPVARPGVFRGSIRTLQRDAVDIEVVIPALNVERRIGPTLTAITRYLASLAYTSAVVVVDNGSADDTPDVVADHAAASPVPVHLTNCALRRKGAAVRRGILSSHARWVGYCDVDVATAIDGLDRVWPLLEGSASVVVESRHRWGAAMVRAQQLTQQVGGRVGRAVARQLLADVAGAQYGFRFFQASVARDLFRLCSGDGPAFDLELLRLARRAGITVVEIPPSPEPDGSAGRPVRDGVRSVVDALMVRLQPDAPGLLAVSLPVADPDDVRES
jgi:dolichyl-phosphate beta-glucosyltransferase